MGIDQAGQKDGVSEVYGRGTMSEVSPASNRCDRAAGNEDRSIVDRRPGDGCDDTGP
jgi:hypothetical protein